MILDDNVYRIHVLRSRYLPGINRWAYKPVLETLIDINDFELHPTSYFGDFNERLLSLLPGLGEHSCSLQAKQGFLTRLAGGTWVGHVLEHVAIELQIMLNINVKFGQTRQTSKKGIYYMVFASPHELVAQEILSLAHLVVINTFYNRPIFLSEELERIKKLAYSVLPGPSTRFILDSIAANYTKAIIRPTLDNLYYVGYGCQSRSFWTSMTENTPALAVELAQDKALSKQFLLQLGLPVSSGVVVTCKSQAWSAAQQWDSVVIKPVNSNRTNGVCLNLRTQEEIYHGFDIANQFSKRVLVERYYPGHEYRFTLVNHEVIGVLTSHPVYVQGNGHDTIETLINELNSDPQRGENDSFILAKIDFDDNLSLDLLRQHVSLTTVLEPGVLICVRQVFNLSDAVSLADFHPGLLAQLSLASRAIGLDVTGIDTIINDIKLPLSEDNGVILELNAGPAIKLHHTPASGNPTPVGDKIAKSLWQQSKPNFLLLSLTGSSFPLSVACALHQHFVSKGKKTALVTRADVIVNNSRWSLTQPLYEQAQQMLLNNQLQVGIIESNLDSLTQYGLSYSLGTCLITIMLDINYQEYRHELFINDAKTVEKIFRTPLDAVPKNGIAILDGDKLELIPYHQYVDGTTVFISQRERTEDLEHLIQHNERILVYKYHQKQLVKMSKNGSDTVHQFDFSTQTDVKTALILHAIEDFLSNQSVSS